ncbi:hypothetical protein SAMN02745229_01118 [Butyrivibrio fibrisolvens DSM 3071]|uniref:Uncharacterized protein n=1 Tax=Butyrivibrio fibrisolvens DSM 3071 TaxID=1121131 RepID=A0A1M5WQC2_BUTFI|nr:hypothetical protein [Butyrivibrio fibrisolvens]SHH89737.1 hypothetical protein SAMN02745229_01118 [Butyrivibrio fibrisolvens DSM 3071]
MKKRIVACLLISTVLMTGCADISLSKGAKEDQEEKSEDSKDQEETDTEGKEKDEVSSDEADKEIEDEASAKASDMASEDDSSDEGDSDGSDQSSKNNTDSEFGPEEGLYDRTYLVKEGDGYIYRLEDEDIIKEYDELYADAFQETYDSYEDYKDMMEEGRGEFDNDGSSDYALVDEKKDFGIDGFGLLDPEALDDGTSKMGSFYEMDYDFDLANVGYTYVDLNSDGIFELIFGIVNGDEWTPTTIFERVYTLIDNKPVHIFEGGSRCYLWLGDDGSIYETGSGGAAYWGMWRYHFDPSQVAPEGTDWGGEGFVADEFLGMWEEYVHIEGEDAQEPDDTAQKSEYKISDDEYETLSEEWEARVVDIDWLLMSDYLEDH